MTIPTVDRRVPTRLAVQILAGGAGEQFLWGALVGGLYIARIEPGHGYRMAIAFLLLTVGFQLSRRWKAVGLLRHGPLTEATVGQVHTMRNRPKIFYVYTDAGGRRYSVEAENVDGPLIHAQPIVYDPAKPSDGFLVRDLPGAPALEADATWRSARPWWPGLILPALAIFGNLACWVLGL